MTVQHILVIDPRQSVLDSFSVLLRAKGFEVIAIADCDGAFLHIDHADLAVLAANLTTPEECKAFIEEFRKKQHRPVIGMTAHLSAGDLEELKECGFDRILPEPLRVSHLVAAIREVQREY